MSFRSRHCHIHHMSWKMLHITFELPPVHYTVVRVAKKQMGVGGDDSWGAHTHPEYLLDVTEKMEFTFCFRGI